MSRTANCEPVPGRDFPYTNLDALEEIKMGATFRQVIRSTTPGDSIFNERTPEVDRIWAAAYFLSRIDGGREAVDKAHQALVYGRSPENTDDAEAVLGRLLDAQ